MKFHFPVALFAKTPLINIATVKFEATRGKIHLRERERDIPRKRVRVRCKWPVDETIIAYVGIIMGRDTTTYMAKGSR